MFSHPLRRGLRHFFQRYVNEVQAFLIGILCTLIGFFLYLSYFRPPPPVSIPEKVKNEEARLEEMIGNTDKLLKELSSSIDNNQKFLDKIKNPPTKQRGSFTITPDRATEKN
ncbi:MAG: hypothetical protein Q7S00_04535 [bacterium]|nr:hypothetical protein [bacterium]